MSNKPNISDLLTLASSESKNLVFNLLESNQDDFLLEDAIMHGLANLILTNIERHFTKGIEHNPAFIIAAFKKYKIFQVNYDFQCNIVHENELDLLFKLLEAKVNFVLLKGFVHGYCLYDDKRLRPKTDVDIIVQASHAKVVLDVFKLNGFLNTTEWQPKQLFSQYTMRKRLGNGFLVDFDVHFEINNNKKLSKLIAYEEIIGTSFLYKIEGREFNFICREYAFIHAIFHLLHHIAEGNHFKAIWLYDIHLLLIAFEYNDLKKLVKIIELKKMQTLTLQALNILNVHFSSDNSDFLTSELAKLKSTDEFKYLVKENNKFNLILSDFMEINKYSDKLIYLKEIFFPPIKEVLQKNPHIKSQTPLFIYLERIYLGVIKFLKKKMEL